MKFDSYSFFFFFWIFDTFYSSLGLTSRDKKHDSVWLPIAISSICYAFRRTIATKSIYIITHKVALSGQSSILYIYYNTSRHTFVKFNGFIRQVFQVQYFSISSGLFSPAFLFFFYGRVGSYLHQTTSKPSKTKNTK